jgi:hypothetical protein
MKASNSLAKPVLTAEAGAQCRFARMREEVMFEGMKKDLFTGK